MTSSAGGAQEGRRTAEDLALPGGDFRLFVQKLGYQAMIALGAIENPLTGTKEPNPAHARSVLEDLEMLRDKTEGNLAEHEREHLETVIRSLRRHTAEGEDDGDGPV